ncbi:MAG: hypothetical protein K2W95_35580 [Candidatus Obscuribacterales bacterium]|nr:hypothetical protein [Candidatus Obscuribacterales bacterium]
MSLPVPRPARASGAPELDFQVEGVALFDLEGVIEFSAKELYDRRLSVLLGCMY